MTIDGDKRAKVGDPTGAHRGSRIDYPYDQGWGLGERPASGPISDIVFPSLGKLPPDSFVLDVGGGDGFLVRNLPPVGQRSFRILSFDQSRAAIAKQKRF